MAESEVTAPDGSVLVVTHPEGASDAEIIDYAKQNHAQATPAASATPPTSGGFPDVAAQQMPDSPLTAGVNFLLPPGKDLTSRLMGAGEKGVNAVASAFTTPAAGLAGLFKLATGQGLNAAADTVRGVQGAAYQPKTESGKAQTPIGSILDWVGTKADQAGQVTSDATGSPLVGSLVKTAILGAPAVYGGRSAIASVAGGLAKGELLPTFGTPPPELPPTPPDTMGLSSESVRGAGDKIVNNVYDTFKQQVGADTQVSMANTLQTAKQVLDEMKRSGAPASAVRRIRNIVENNTTTEGPLSLLDVINKTARDLQRANPGMGKLVDATVTDMDAAGKLAGVENFQGDLGTARAFGELYKDSSLGKVVGRYGDQLEAFKANDPAGYQEITTDWAGKKLQDFVKTNEVGGRGFDVKGFSKWVNDNQANLEQIVGPEAVGVWQAFPKWHGAATFLKGLGQRFVEAKTMGLSKFFSKEVDTKFADGIARSLTDPTSPLYRALAKGTADEGTAGSLPSLPGLALQGELNGQVERR
jgi:hypothetical protein